MGITAEGCGCKQDGRLFVVRSNVEKRHWFHLFLFVYILHMTSSKSWSPHNTRGVRRIDPKVDNTPTNKDEAAARQSLYALLTGEPAE